MICLCESGLNSKHWHRERIVSGILESAVVANRNTTLGGGSSNVLSKALKAQDGVYTVMLCKQDIKANQQFALKELVKARLQNRYFKMLSDRFVLNLKRKALIDIRMQN